LVVGGRHGEVNGSRSPPVDLGELVVRSREGGLQPFNLAEPALALGLGDAGDEVVADLLQPAALGRVRPEERATNASVFMNTRA
jgi:hypothetical protein